MTKPLHKAVIVLGFGSADGADGSARSLHSGDGAGVRRAVREALAAGLKELIFVTTDSLTPAEAQFGEAGSGKAERVVIARQFAAGCLGEALCGVRHLLNEEPFVLLLPSALGEAGDDSSTTSLVAAYRESGGNIIAISDETVLQRDGCFTAIRAAACGRYLLQPAVLDALEEDPEAGLAEALLATAEVWPVTALPPRPASVRLRPLVPPSEAPTVRGPRPIPTAAAAANVDGGDWPGNAGL